MSERRKSHRRLTGTRIYQRRNRFAYYSPQPLVNPATGKATKWHFLCPVSDGEQRARELAQAIIDYNRYGAIGDLPMQMQKYLTGVMTKRNAKAPTDPARLKMFQAGSREIRRICNVIEDAFRDFNVAQVQPVDVARFVDQWAGQRAAQVYKSRLSDFMSWCVRGGLRSDNPCREVAVEEPGTRKRYITDAEFYAIYDLLAPMAQCYVDLCYLLYQRATEIRLLRWEQITDAGIFFQPTKTEASSGARVLVPLTPEIAEVLDRAKACGESAYVIHTGDGKPYTTTGIGSAWRRAREKAGVQDASLKDLRAKAATDAEKAGYALQHISVGLAHTNVAQTQDYIKLRETPESTVRMRRPVRPDRQSS